MNEVVTSIPNWLNYIFGFASVISLLLTIGNFVMLLRLSKKIKKKRSLQFLRNQIDEYIERIKEGGAFPRDYLKRIKETMNKIKRYYNESSNKDLYQYMDQITCNKKVDEDNADHVIENLELIKIEIEDII